MIIACPKCGFTQPKDKYCAKCGVDMETYVPPKVPVWKKLAFNPFVHVCLLVLIVAGVVLFIHQNSKQEIMSRVEYLKGNSVHLAQSTQSLPPQAPAGTQAAGEAAPATTAATDATAANVATAESANLSPDAPSTEAATTVASKDETAKAIGPATKESRVKVKVYYLVVPAGELQKLMDESSTTGQLTVFGEYSAGVLPHIKQKLSDSELSAAGISVLQKIERNIDMTNPNSQWFLGSKENESESELGLTTMLSVNEATSAQIKGEVELMRNLREGNDPNSPPIRKSFPASFELSKDNGFFMAGVLPRRTLTESEIDLFNNNLLRVMNSPQFKHRQTEFVIIYDFNN